MINDLGMGIVVTMRDMFSRNAAKIESSMDSLDAKVAASSERMTRNLDRIQKGTMMMGAGLALMAAPAALVASTAATQKALGEMASLGTKDLRTLEDAAESFSNQWAGASKAEFIGACYDVKSALANLSDEAVGTFGAMAAITAKATKATVQEMVGTFTTGYGIFKPIMKKYSDIDWAKAFSGAMAQTVAVFKTTGPQMAEAIKNVGATAAASNIPLTEQLAILGQLQTTMPGSEAGTLYKAFIMKAAEAGKELGLPFVDATGRLKGILPVLQEIQNRFPDLSQAGAQVIIKKAFGSDEAVKFLLQMSAGMDSLGQNIRSIDDAMKGGVAVTEEMARAMNVDIGSQFGLAKQQVLNLFEIMGRTLLPVVTQVMAGISHVVLWLQRMAKAAPGVTGAVLGLALSLGAVLVVVGAVIAAVGTIGLMAPAVSAGIAAIGPALAGVGAAVATYFWPVTLAVAAVIAAVFLLRQAWNTNFAGIQDTVMGVWNKISLAFQGVRALIASFKDDTGEMSAELAQKLQAAGLMGFVTTVFQVYTRVREFVAGFAQAMGHAFGRVRAILEPPVRALVNACMTFWRALFSIVEVFGVMGTAADASSFRTFGQVLGTLLGVIAQAGAFILRGLIYPMILVARVLAVVARAVVWLAKMIVMGFVESARFILKFLFPVRLLVEAFRLSGQVIYSVWQILTGDVSLTEGLKNIGGAVLRFLATPFRWAWDVITAIWDGIKVLFVGAWRLLGSMASALTSAFLNLPLVSTLVNVFGAVRSFLSGDLGFFEAGKAVLMAFARGIWATVTLPYQMLKKALGWLRRLLPFSDAEEGPLSDLTASGAGLLKTLAQGMLGVIGLPGKVLGLALRTAVRAISWAWGALRSVGSGLVSVVSWPFRKAADVARGAWDGIQAGANGIWDGMKAAGSMAASAATAPFRWIAGAASAAWNSIEQGAANAWNRAASLAQSAASAVSAAQDWMAATGATAWNTLREATASVWSGIATAASEAAGTVTNTFAGIANAAGQAWTSLTSSATTAWVRMTSLAQGAGAWLRAPFDGLASVASRSWETVRGAASGTWDWMRSSVTGLIQSAAVGGKGMLDSAVAGIQNILASPVESARSVLRQAWNMVPFGGREKATAPTPAQSGKISGVVDSVLPEIASAAEAFVLALRNAVDRVSGFTGNAFAGAAKSLLLAGAAAGTSLSAVAVPSPMAAQEIPVHQVVSTAPVLQAGPMPRQRMARDIPASLLLTPALASPVPPVTAHLSLRPVLSKMPTTSGANLLLNPLMPDRISPLDADVNLSPILAAKPTVMAGDMALRPHLSGVIPPVTSSVELAPQIKGRPSTVTGELGLTPVVRKSIPPLASNMAVAPILTGNLPPMTGVAALTPRVDSPVPTLSSEFAATPVLMGMPTVPNGKFGLSPYIVNPMQGLTSSLALSPEVRGALPNITGDLRLTPRLTGGLPNMSTDAAVRPVMTGQIPSLTGKAAITPQLAATVPAPVTNVRLLPAPIPSIPDTTASLGLMPRLAGEVPALSTSLALLPGMTAPLPTFTGKAGLRPYLSETVPAVSVTATLVPKLQGRPSAASAEANLRPVMPRSISPVGVDAILSPVLPHTSPTIAGKMMLAPQVAGSVPRVTGALSLTLHVTSQPFSVPNVYTAMSSTDALPSEDEPVPVVSQQDGLSPERARLLGATRGVSVGMPQPSVSEDGIQAIRYLMETALAKLDALAERPIAVSVTMCLDGRQIAQSVYKDLRERKVKNYETL